MKWKLQKEIEGKEDHFIVITWPEIQYFMDKPGFEDNSELINSPSLLSQYGSSAYFIRWSWFLLYGQA